MFEVRYSRAKMVGGALVAALTSGFLLMLFLYPEERIPGIIGRMVSGTFGHYVTVPPLTVFCTILTFRMAWMAAGQSHAVVADEAGLSINWMWRSYASTGATWLRSA